MGVAMAGWARVTAKETVPESRLGLSWVPCVHRFKAAPGRQSRSAAHQDGFTADQRATKPLTPWRPSITQTQYRDQLRPSSRVPSISAMRLMRRLPQSRCAPLFFRRLQKSPSPDKRLPTQRSDSPRYTDARTVHLSVTKHAADAQRGGRTRARRAGGLALSSAQPVPRRCLARQMRRNSNAVCRASAASLPSEANDEKFPMPFAKLVPLRCRAQH